jgi:hypothetical protein
MFTVQAATPASAAALYSALSPFHPELETNDEGRCSVSVALGSDRHVVQVLDAIHEHLRSHGEDGTVTFADCGSGRTQVHTPRLGSRQMPSRAPSGLIARPPTSTGSAPHVRRSVSAGAVG